MERSVKYYGPDLLPARVLKEIEIGSFLTIIFQKSFDTGIAPKDWRTANVTAIFKKGEKYKASNYRPVSLTSLCCKIREHIVTSNVLKHLDEHEFKPPVKYFTDRSKAVLLLWIFYVLFCLVLAMFCARLFICALWSPAG